MYIKCALPVMEGQILHFTRLRNTQTPFGLVLLREPLREGNSYPPLKPHISLTPSGCYNNALAPRRVVRVI